MITCFIYKNFDNSLFSLWFLSNNKNVDITFAFIKKKQNRKNDENYYRVSIFFGSTEHL